DISPAFNENLNKPLLFFAQLAKAAGSKLPLQGTVAMLTRKPGHGQRLPANRTGPGRPVLDGHHFLSIIAFFQKHFYYNISYKIINTDINIFNIQINIFNNPNKKRVEKLHPAFFTRSASGAVAATSGAARKMCERSLAL